MNKHPKKMKLKHRSPMPPPSQIHKDKRKKTRAQEKRDVYNKINEIW